MNNIWQRIKCSIFGHEWVDAHALPGYIGADRNCICGAHTEAIRMPFRSLPVPSTEQQILAELKAIRAALEAQSKPVQYEIKNAVSSQASQSQIAAAARGADRSRRNN